MICNNRMTFLMHIMQQKPDKDNTVSPCKRRRCGTSRRFVVFVREEAFLKARSLPGHGHAKAPERHGWAPARRSVPARPPRSRHGRVRSRLSGTADGAGVSSAGACAFSRLRKECRREWSRDWAGIPAHRRPPSLPAARIPRRRSLPGCRGTCRRKWRRCPRR